MATTIDCHCNETIEKVEEIGLRRYISEPE